MIRCIFTLNFDNLTKRNNTHYIPCQSIMMSNQIHRIKLLININQYDYDNKIVGYRTDKFEQSETSINYQVIEMKGLNRKKETNKIEK